MKDSQAGCLRLRRIGVLGSLLMLASVALPVAYARAEAERVVVLALSDSPLSRRVIAELSSLGFVAELRLLVKPPQLEQLKAFADARGAGAALWISGSERAARLWLFDRLTNKALWRDVVVARDDGDPTAAIATSAVELLRASLLELTLPRASPAPSAPQRPLPNNVMRSHALSLGMAVSGTPQGLGPLFPLQLGLSIYLQRWLRLAASALVPLYPKQLSRTEGSARLWCSALAVSVRVPLFQSATRWAAHVGVGGMGVMLLGYGSASAPYVSRASRALAAGPLLELGGRLALARGIGLRLELSAGLMTSAVAVRFGSTTVERFGQPILSAGLGMDVLL